METHFTWKRKLFSNIYEIFEYENLAGQLKSTGWKRMTLGDLKGEKLKFEIKGLFDKEFLIKHPDDDSVIGQIVFNMWRTKATISLRDKEYQWGFDNLFHTKWSISNENGPLVKYDGHFKSGEIISYIMDNSLILTGVYIKDYLNQRAAASASAAT